MYKVFIDNKAIFFNLKTETELLIQFKDHNFIEAAGGLVQSNQKFLFIKRQDVWDIPKGKLEKNEEVEAGALREIEEECGFKPGDLRINKKLMDTWHTYQHKGDRVLKKTHWFLIEELNSNKDLKPQEEEGITEVKYFGREEFDIVLSNTYLSIADVISAL